MFFGYGFSPGSREVCVGCWNMDLSSTASSNYGVCVAMKFLTWKNISCSEMYTRLCCVCGKQNVIPKHNIYFWKFLAERTSMKEDEQELTDLSNLQQQNHRLCVLSLGGKWMLLYNFKFTPTDGETPPPPSSFDPAQFCVFVKPSLWENWALARFPMNGLTTIKNKEWVLLWRFSPIITLTGRF